MAIMRRVDNTVVVDVCELWPVNSIFSTGKFSTVGLVLALF